MAHGSTPQIKGIDAKDGKIFNILVSAVNTQYSHTFSNRTKQFTIRARGNATLKISFVSGETNVKFKTLDPANEWEIRDLSLSGKTIYFESNIINETIEITEFI